VKSAIVKKQKPAAIFAFLFMTAALIFGYLSFGFWASLIFTVGFLGGYILWLFVPTGASFRYLSIPYFLTLSLFAVHKIEEKQHAFLQALAKLTGGPVPSDTSFQVIMLLVLSIGAWLLAPFLVARKYAFGYYLMWTFSPIRGSPNLPTLYFRFSQASRTDTFPEW